MHIPRSTWALAGTLLVGLLLAPSVRASGDSSNGLENPPLASLDDLDRAAQLAGFLEYAAEQEPLHPHLYQLGPYTSEGTTLEIRWAATQLTPFASDWQPYTGTFGLEEASHLLGRTVIGARFQEIDAAVQRGLDATVDRLLEDRPSPESPGDWATMPHPDTEEWTEEQIHELFSQYWERRDPLRLWWVQNMLDADDNLTEEMTLFWHEHFATSVERVQLPQSMYVQNQLLREHALGNFKELVSAVAVDPAMLIWLDGIDNRDGHINENFGRELLELFTLGVGNYTEDDVRAAARGFTGWVTPDGVTSVFDPERFDDGEKTFLGETGNWDGQDIIDIIFEQDQTARFLCAKLFRWFVDENPPAHLVDDLAQTLRDNDYEMKPVLDRMLSSRQFHHLQMRGSLITDGIDRTVGPLRSLEVSGIDLSDPWNPQAQWVLFSMAQFGMILFEPPDVSGWEGYRAWINSTTLPWRKTLDVAVVEGQIDGWELGMEADVVSWAQQLQDPYDAELLVHDLGTHLFGMAPTPLVYQTLLDELLQGAEPWEWSLEIPGAEDRLRGVLSLALRLPDYQVK